MNVLCVDTEPEAAQAIAAAGHAVEQGDLGYRTGRPALRYPPHEFDLIVCDLHGPACYDATFWGPGKNDNYHCRIEKEVDGTTLTSRDGRTRPRYEIIHSRRMPGRPPSSFGPDDIRQAVSKAGVPFLLFLNGGWVRHAGSPGPDFCGVAWSFRRTKATKVEHALSFPERIPLTPALPLEYALEGRRRSMTSSTFFRTKPLLVNKVGDVFGEVVPMGKGTIWALPPTVDNPAFCVSVLEHFEEFRDLSDAVLRASFPSAHAGAMPVGTPVGPGPSEATRDVFICHASEDKAAVARPLAEALRGRSLSVWFDEYELVLGDRLRRKIEEGLRASRFGVVILSESFFQKEWPQAELDALFALERESQRILPVWHGLTVEDVGRLAPLLADRLAVATDKGVAPVVTAVLEAVARRSG